MSVLQSPPPPRVRGAARVPAARARASAGPSHPVRRPVPGRVGPVSLGQVVVGQAALGAVVVALAAPRVVLAVVAVVAAAVLVLTFGRSGDRWLYESLARRRALTARRRAAGTPTADPRRDALAALAPGFGVHAVSDRGHRMAVGTDAGGWFVVLEIAAPEGVGVGAVPPLPLAALARALAEGGVGLSGLQVVTHTVPVTGAGLDERSPCMASYRQLAGDRYGTLPAHRYTWLALRLDAAAGAAAAEPRGGGPEGVDRALVASVARIGKVLSAAGLRHRALDVADLLDALALSCGLGVGAAVEERWEGVALDGTVHVTWALASWPEQTRDDPGLLSRLSRLRAAPTSVSLTIGEPDDDRVSLRALVRISAPPAGVAAAVTAFEEGAATAGARLQRLDGEQAAGLYATAPTGGGMR
jgi:type VII secretion protein EccE